VRAGHTGVAALRTIWRVTLPAAPPTTPPAHGPRRVVLILVLALVMALVLTIGIIIVIRPLVDKSTADFPDNWFTATFTISPKPTAAQADDAGQAVLAELGHLGDEAARYVVHGDKVAVGTPDENDRPLISLALQSRLTPSVVLRSMVSGDFTTPEQQTGEDCNVDLRTDIACSADRKVIGTFGDTFLAGSDISDATAAEDTSTGQWTVTVRFTSAGQAEFASAVSAETGRVLVFLVTVTTLDPNTWGLTPMLADRGIDSHGQITRLDQIDATEIAATLRLCRQHFQLMH
jgi:hypothetical protein